MSATANIHLIVGEDDYLAEATARKIVEAAVPAGDSDAFVSSVSEATGRRAKIVPMGNGYR